MKSINPTREGLARFREELPKNTPVVMLNLLKFREKALYPSGTGFQDCSGRQAYRRYADIALEHLSAIGGKAIWMSKAMSSLIAPEGETWDEVLLVRYPSSEAFLKMLQVPEYLAATIHREASLEDSRLIATIEIFTEMA
ncbi:MAG: DUF1330 domain-containing protein [Syntrophaceae bacterium]|nr:DUF1330 domain-containing protein [Deltaproteobacteria bacterium]